MAFCCSLSLQSTDTPDLVLSVTRAAASNWVLPQPRDIFCETPAAEWGSTAASNWAAPRCGAEGLVSTSPCCTGSASEKGAAGLLALAEYVDGDSTLPSDCLILSLFCLLVLTAAFASRATPLRASNFRWRSTADDRDPVDARARIAKPSGSAA